MGGDSAGANLAAAVLSHILHPHPEIEPLAFENGAGKLRAAVLLAPWVSFRHGWPSGTDNAGKDVVTRYAADVWSESFLGGKQSDGYNEPLSLAAEDGWWRGLEGVVGECLVTGGGDEVLADVVRELGRRFQAVHTGVTVLIAEREWHDKPVLLSFGAGGEQDAAIRSFVNSRFGA